MRVWMLAMASLTVPLAQSAAQPSPAQPPAAEQTQGASPQSSGSGGSPQATNEELPTSPNTPRGESPYADYASGNYEGAMQGFVDWQVEQPKDPRLMLNVGSTQYKMRDYEAAKQSFAQALSHTHDPTLRGQALYNLGNVAFREGKLDEAIKYYQQALEQNPEDEDAKYNLEYTRNEIRRRHEEAQKRQEQQEQQPQQGAQQEQDQESQQQQQDSQQDAQKQQDGQQQSSPQDSDGDGLADQLERSAKNPTDPTKADSDGDGLPDGQEDQNHNGQVDAGETDPNNADSDGDGTPDGKDPTPAATPAQDQSQQQPEQGDTLSPQDAARYLDNLEEKRPDRRRQIRGRRPRPAKDW